MDSGAIAATALDGIGEIKPGDDLAAIAVAASTTSGLQLGDGQIVVISQKAVSKAEGRIVLLDNVEPDNRAREVAAATGKDPRFVQLVLDESVRVLRTAPNVLITETRQGWICANAGIDSSNTGGSGTVTLLPADADESARRIRARLRELTGTSPAVVITDSFGRPWRRGSVEIAIGCAGINPLDDWRGRRDMHGSRLRATVVSAADQVASMADLARTKSDGRPVVVIDGLARLVTPDDGPGATVVQRDRERDLFP